MKRNISKIFKQDDSINVYQNISNPDIVYKEYLYFMDEIATIEDMKLARKKHENSR